MQITATTSTTTPQNSAAVDAFNAKLQAKGGQSTLGQTDFLQLLSTQLQNQDPMNPQSDTDFISQMASFSSLQQMNTLTSDFQSFSTYSQMSAAQQYLGKQVILQDPQMGTVTGTVSSIDTSGSMPKIVINGNTFDVSSIQSVIASAAASGTASTSNQ